MVIETVGLGIDSMVACLAVAPLLPRLDNRLAVAGALGLADGAASIGASAGGVALYAIAAAIVLVALGFAVRWPGARRWAALAVLLSIDNLTTPLAPQDAVVAGAASFAMGVVGFALALVVYRVVPAGFHKRAAIAFGALAIVAVVLL